MTDFAARRVTMVDTQVRPADVTRFPIIDAMLEIPRERFVPFDRIEAAYVGGNIDLGGGRAVLDPRTIAKMIEEVDVDPADAVLTLACGPGYATALLARMAQVVVGVEDDPDLARQAETELSALGLDNAVVVAGAPAEGAPKLAPFDVIVVEGGVQTVPDAVLEQLRDGGRIVALFMRGQLGEARVGHRAGGVVSWRPVFNADAPILPGFTARPVFTF
ncbi:MAG: protein-L-isoaspartate O-methyltransferase family protein [Paracoccaceae bacterium]